MKEFEAVGMRLNAKKVKKIVFKLILFAFFGYVIFLFINQFIKIKTKNEELNGVKEKIAIQEKKNKEMKEQLENISNNSDDNSFQGKNSETIVFENVTE